MLNNLYMCSIHVCKYNYINTVCMHESCMNIQYTDVYSIKIHMPYIDSSCSPTKKLTPKTYF